MITINNLTVRLGGRAILQGASAAIPPGGRIGLIGRNGAGKSTLMKALIGQIDPDEGSVDLPRRARLGYIAQEAPSGSITPFEAVLAGDAVFASNTSALPISELAEASARPAHFVGMHFFSPAEKMPLVEIIAGASTSDETLARAFDLAQQLGKTPIVVNDAPGFFTTRVIGKTVSQGSEMLEQGVNPVLIEAAARDNGSPVGPLAAIDEISQETAYKNGQQAKADALAQGRQWQDNAPSRVLDRMVNEFGRRGKIHGGGYYDYPEGARKRMWPGLKEAFAPQGYRDIPYQDIKDRLVFCQCLEAVRAMEEGVIESVGDGNIGSIMGIGFPAQTGGVFQAINAYGLEAFVARARELEARYGSDFAVPGLLVRKAEQGELFL